MKYIKDKLWPPIQRLPLSFKSDRLDDFSKASTVSKPNEQTLMRFSLIKISLIKSERYSERVNANRRWSDLPPPISFGFYSNLMTYFLLLDHWPITALVRRGREIRRKTGNGQSPHAKFIKIFMRYYSFSCYVPKRVLVHCIWLQNKEDSNYWLKSKKKKVQDY